jgi:DNA polymerase III subunit delta
MPTPRFKPVYVLHGNDEFLRDAHRRRIVQEVLGEADPQLALSTFAADADLADVLDDLRTLPLLAPCRLVAVRDADDFVTAHRQALEDYLDDPSPSGSLLLLVSSWPASTKLAKRVAQIGQAFPCSSPAGEDLAQWLTHAARKRGKELADDAARLLEQYAGSDLAALDAEVEKLSLYAADRPTITAQDVSLLTAATAGPAAFALVDAIAASNAKMALTVLDKTLTRRGLEFQVLGQIAWHLRNALKGKSFRQARPPAKLRADFRRVLEADLAMKSGADARATMQDLVLALCR